jgi:glucans biosynthesis protein C
MNLPAENNPARLDYLDATRAFALVLGVVFHASLSYMPVFIGWPVQDVSTSMAVAAFATISHAFRLELFFLLAGFFGHLTLVKKGMAELLKSRALRILVPFALAWFVLRPLVVSGFIMAYTINQPDFSFGGCIVAGFEDLKKLPTGLWVGTHLWFLYYLALITTLVLVARQALKLLPQAFASLQRVGDQSVSWMSKSSWALPVAVVILVPLLGQMDGWGVDTPDKSLVPHVPSLLLYGSFFVLGWLLHRQTECVSRFAQLSWKRGAVAVAGMAVTLYLVRYQIDPGHPHHHSARHIYNVSYAVMMWTLVWLTIGLFRRFCSQPNRFIRYVADSSYWMYLIHLPVVIWLQVGTAELEAYWLLKLIGITGVTVAICLLTYDLFVRPSVIGKILNGRRRPRGLVLKSAM